MFCTPTTFVLTDNEIVDIFDSAICDERFIIMHASFAVDIPTNIYFDNVIMLWIKKSVRLKTRSKIKQLNKKAKKNITTGRQVEIRFTKDFFSL